MGRASASSGNRRARTFAAFIAPAGVWLVEYQAERTGTRVVQQWSTLGQLASMGDAMDRLRALVSSLGAMRASLGLVIEQFGVVHHTMTVPGAPDEVLRPIAQREMQRVFGMDDAAVVFTRGGSEERRESSRAESRTAPPQLSIAAAPHETIDALRNASMPQGVDVTLATVVPSAMRGLYLATGGALEATAILVCLDTGPHLAFFLDGRMELVMEPPVASEGERASADAIVDQVERGTIYFRQQFRGATPTRVLLAARADEYHGLAAALERRLGARVSALFGGIGSPEAVVAMGGVVGAQSSRPLDLFPHPPSLRERAAVALRGPNAIVAGVAAATILAIGWSSMQFAALSTARNDVAALETSVRTALPAVARMRQVAEQREDVVTTRNYLREVRDERTTVTRTLADIASSTPVGIQFDSLRAVRSASGWTAIVQGESRAATTAEAVRSLDAFYRTMRGVQGIGSPNIDQFDYRAPTPADSTHEAAGPEPVVLEFRVSFAIARVDTTLEALRR